MDDLNRLFRHLVDVLASTDPKRLTAPFQISELYQSILPYRQFKTNLGFECSEDYEMAVLRLCAGEANYADVEPDEVKRQLLIEAQAVHPNPSAFREFAAARLRLNPEAVRAVRGSSHAYEPPPTPASGAGDAEQWDRFAPPGDQPTEPIVNPPVFQAAAHAEGGTGDAATSGSPGQACPSCNKKLPQHRAVAFCPFCGCQVGPASCPSCGDEIEVGWNFCASCGRAGSGA